MAEDAAPMTLQQRIAALNAAHIGRLPNDSPPAIRTKPQLPDHRPSLVKHNTVNIPHEQVNGTVTDRRIGNQPNGPPKLPARRQPPPLPNRSGTGPAPAPVSRTAPGRTSSISSTTSTATSETNSLRLTTSRTTSDDNRIKAPAWGECELPPLPAKAEQERPQPATRKSSYGQNAVSTAKSGFASVKQTRPPPLPGRPPAASNIASQATTSEPPIRRLAPMPTAASIDQAKKAAFSLGTTAERESEEAAQAPVKPPRNQSIRQAVTQVVADSKPPPIPLASRPDLSAIQATKPKFNAQPAVSDGLQGHNRQNECMTCRDFSGPDNHAARFPRQQVTSLADLGYQLTAPFPSLTDKARAIFTWMHHNIAYDAVAFFGKCVQPSTPQSTLQTGLAVCEGYAALYTNLCNHAGLESVVISGDGRGYGYTPWFPGQPLPPFSSNHAWNAVKIDGGEWKLIESCWGSGYIQGEGQPYIPHFTPRHFTMSNEEFGTKHFPSNKTQFYLPGGRTLSWEEYVQLNPDLWPYDVELPTLYGNGKDDFGIGQNTILPRGKTIKINSPSNPAKIRFQFGLICEHWSVEKQNKGPPPVFVLGIHGLDGRKDDLIPFEPTTTSASATGVMWYVDVSVRELGAPGQKLMIYTVETVGNRKNCRGLTVREFLQSKGKTSMSWSAVAGWDLV